MYNITESSFNIHYTDGICQAPRASAKNEGIGGALEGIFDGLDVITGRLYEWFGTFTISKP